MRDLEHLKGLVYLGSPMCVAVTMIASLNSADAAARYYHGKAEKLSLTMYLSQSFGKS